jgi:hypothetical protein
MFGAAWTAFACQVLTVVGGWFLGTSLFPVWLPIGQVVRRVAAVVPMIVGMTLIRFPLDWFGLSASVLLGGMLYVASAILLDVGQMRSLGLDMLRRRIMPRVSALTD